MYKVCMQKNTASFWYHWYDELEENMRLQPLKKQPALHAILRRNPFSVYECEVWEARGTSDFLGGGRVNKIGQGA